jgi:hypothetical protein
MNQLCIDNWLEILDYSSIEEYATLRLTSKFFGELIDNSTCFLDIAKTINEEHLVMEKRKIFYKLCSLKRFYLAKFIHNKFSLNLNVLKDGIFFKYCNLYDIEIARNILAIQGFNVSKYEFLKEENYSKVIDFLKQFENKLLFPNLNSNLIDSCNSEDEELDKIQLACLFGDKRNLAISSAIKICCDKRKYNCMKYLLSVVNKYNENSIGKYFFNVCREKSVYEVRIFIENFKMKRKYLFQGFLESLLSRNLNVSKYLFSILDSDTDNPFTDSCNLNNLEYTNFILEKMDKNDIIQTFIMACENGNKEIYDILIKVMDANCLDIALSDNKFLNFCMRNTKIIEMIVSQDFCSQNELLKLIKYACLNSNIHIVEYLLNFMRIENSIMNSIIIECCELGNHDIVKYLNRIFKFPLRIQFKCFEKCLVNRHFSMIGFFSRKNEKHLLKHLRKNIDVSELNEIFKDACYENNLRVVKWITRIIELETEILNQGVIICFERGCLKVCEFIISFHKISLDILNNCFLESCKQGHDDFVNLALSINPIDNKIVNEGFVLACKYGHESIYHFLYTNTRVDVFYDNEKALYESCQNNQIDTTYWLNTLADDKVKMSIEDGTRQYERKFKSRFNFEEIPFWFNFAFRD